MHVTAEAFGEAWFLTGPTAIGKSEAGIELAERLADLTYPSIEIGLHWDAGCSLTDACLLMRRCLARCAISLNRVSPRMK